MIITESFRNSMAFDNHEKIFKFTDVETGLIAYVALHNLKLGKAIGGTRMYNYPSEEAAVLDALNLSKAMSYKCAFSGIHQGGGKGIIVGDPKKNKTEPLLKAYARKINELEGIFITGEDVGLSEEDVQVMFEESNFFVGKSGLAGDPSPFAAKSVFHSIQVAVEEIFNVKSLNGITVAVKGVGKVGGALVELLNEAGVNVAIADIEASKIQKIIERHPEIKVIDPEKIHEYSAEIFSPCAMGGDLNPGTVPQLKCKIICGGANNQLSDEGIGDILHKKGILYIVDYIANAGGLINVADELEEGGYSKERVTMRIEKIKDTVRNLIESSKDQDIATNRLANMMAESILNENSNV